MTGLASTTSSPPAVVVLLVAAAGVMIAIVSRRYGRHRAERRLAQLRSAPNASDTARSRDHDASRASKTVNGYWRMLGARPGNRLWVIAAICSATVAWRSEGTVAVLVAIVLASVVVFPIGFLVWRRLRD